MRSSWQCGQFMRWASNWVLSASLRTPSTYAATSVCADPATLSSPPLAQGPAQRADGVVDAGLDGARGHAEGRRDLVDGPIAQVGLLDGLPLLGRKALQRFVNDHRGERAVRFVGHTDRVGFDLLDLLGTGTAAAPAVDHGTPGHREQPGTQHLRAAVELVGVAPRLDQGL